MRCYFSKWLFAFSDREECIGCIKNFPLNPFSQNNIQTSPIQLLQSSMILVLAVVILISMRCFLVTSII